VEADLRSQRRGKLQYSADDEAEYQRIKAQVGAQGLQLLRALRPPARLQPGDRHPGPDSGLCEPVFEMSAGLWRLWPRLLPRGCFRPRSQRSEPGRAEACAARPQVESKTGKMRNERSLLEQQQQVGVLGRGPPLPAWRLTTWLLAFLAAAAATAAEV
jgi:hypothetical protein